tara:strand:+ start:20 stop:310 length:291 start_codon:yes stop_codon:yes gene_type:complete
MDWEKAYHILEEYISWDPETKKEDIEFLKERINMCDPVYRILKGATDETIKKAQERLTKETGYGVPNDKRKKRKSKRKKTAKLCEGSIERNVSQIA